MRGKVKLLVLVTTFAVFLSSLGYLSYKTIMLNQENSTLEIALDEDKQLKRINELTDELSALQYELSSNNDVSGYLNKPVTQALTYLYSSASNVHPGDYLSPAAQKKYTISQPLPVSSSLKIKELHYSKNSSTQYNVMALCQYFTGPKGSGSTVSTNLLLGLIMEFHNGKWLLQTIYLEQYFNHYIDKTGGVYE